MGKVRVTVWNEFRHEKHSKEIAAIYPEGIHGAIARYLRSAGDFEVATATLDEAEHGLSESRVGATDVLIWWGHTAHDEVSDLIVDRIQERVLAGMGLIVLHSGHFSKIFKRLMGTNCSLRWREIGEKERLWNVAPGHEITEGIGDYIELPHAEMYGERFDIPDPDKLIFLSWYAGGEVFRSGCVWERGNGRVFYFKPGHETFPVFFNEQILKVIGNACRWAAPRVIRPTNEATNIPRPLEHVPVQGS